MVLLVTGLFNSNANDESGNGNDGTVNGATLTTDRFGNANSAYDFDGVNDFIVVNDAPELRVTNTDFTMSAWINIISYGTQYAIFSKRSSASGANGYVYLVASSTANPPGMIMYTASGSTDPESYTNNSVTLNQWVHATITFDVNTGDLATYINRELDSITLRPGVQISLATFIKKMA
jgi:hypothetical protein